MFSVLYKSTNQLRLINKAQKAASSIAQEAVPVHDFDDVNLLSDEDDNFDNLKIIRRTKRKTKR